MGVTMRKTKIYNLLVLFGVAIFLSLGSCNFPQSSDVSQNGQAGFNYLKTLKGIWVEKEEKKQRLKWAFDYSTKLNMVVEIPKYDSPEEMSTNYQVEGKKLVADHFDASGGPHPFRLISIIPKNDADLYFLCNGAFVKTKAHGQLHMHSYQFKKKGDNLIVQIEMFENNKTKSKTAYELTRAN